MLERYVAQVRLLVDVLPDVAKESEFALNSLWKKSRGIRTAMHPV